MSTDTTENTTPKTAAQAWAAIHRFAGEGVRATLEDADIEGAIHYAEKMAKVEARFPPDHPIHFTEATISDDWRDRLTPAEAYALGRKDHEIPRLAGGLLQVECPSVFERVYPDGYAKKLEEMLK